MLRRDQPAMTVLLGALIAVAPLAMDIYLASMPSMTRSLSATPEQVQLTLSLYMYGWGVTQIFVGPLTDRFGRRPALIAGLALFVAASLACAVARNIETLIAARVAQAIGMGTVAVVPRAIVRDLYSGEHAARMLSLMGIVLGIAPIVAPIIGSHLHVWFGWQANFVFVAAYGATALACVIAAFPETIRARDVRATTPEVILANYGSVLRSRTYIGYVLVAASGSSGLFAFLAGSAFVFVNVIGTGEEGFGFLFGAVMLGNIIGATVGSRVVVRLGIDRMLGYSTWLMLFSGLALAALAWGRVAHPLAIVVPMFLFMVALMTTMPQATAGALSAFPEIAGSAASLLLFCQFVLASTSALIVGMTFDGSERPMATTIDAATLLAFVIFRVLVRTRRAAGSREAT
ncbi:MAG: multidrug effflux MFS transporter [Betaproteobacteria bacterium]|nr:MAG: multidrug effflux MFS transporter [Betaproteobacteria bacterium]